MHCYYKLPYTYIHMVGLALWYIVADIYIRSAVFSVCACVCVCVFVCVYVVLNIRCTGIMFTKMHITVSSTILQCCALRQGPHLLQPFVIKGFTQKFISLGLYAHTITYA